MTPPRVDAAPDTPRVMTEDNWRVALYVADQVADKLGVPRAVDTVGATRVLEAFDGLVQVAGRVAAVEDRIAQLETAPDALEAAELREPIPGSVASLLASIIPHQPRPAGAADQADHDVRVEVASMVARWATGTESRS